MSVLEKLSGRILDADSHEHTPAQLWEQTFGPSTAGFSEMLIQMQSPEGINSLNADLKADDAPFSADPEKIWRKGARAPGAFDMARRIEFLDQFGINETFVFPTGPGLMGQMLA